MRKAEIKDLNKIVNIIVNAKKSLKDEGIDQWQIDSMNEDFLARQIATGKSFVYEEFGVICAYAFLSDEKEEAYKPWEDDFEGKKPLTIHTFAVDLDMTKRGIATKFFIDIIIHAEKNSFDALRIDTHEDNFKMRGLINKLGFRKIGQIFIDEEGTKKPRICYERFL
ncbi:GNAT family N-acetyltransferase [uncultured Anaerococcus sp.]|uniref:GNAT family N-acetyltransferase n=1 Tax=uncultured Anaerococcus sp. TaxID=293428 RepID=UPI00280B1BE0|nr:GNAT family N-acetyltransferase [uncultured Anaerococcus sp.]